MLPSWYASPGDFVFIEEVVSPRFFSTLPKELRPAVTPLSVEDIRKKGSSFPAMEAAPWGISPQSIHLYNELRNKGLDVVDIPSWKDDYSRLTSRQTAADCFRMIKEQLPDMPLPDVPLFFTSLPEIENFLQEHPKAYLCKSPFSSSGRGLLWLDSGILQEKDKSWIKGVISKQGSVSLEPILNKWSDFALEYYFNGEGDIDYKGISVFETNKRGAYKGNALETQQTFQAFLDEKIGTEKFKSIKNAVECSLQKLYGNLYKGYLGVDMLLYKQANDTLDVHPCIEINMRYTMGMAAIQIFEQYIHPDAIGNLTILYNSNPKMTNEIHKLNIKAYPLEIENGKLRSGYLSLCPVTKDTHYMACIIVM